MFHVKHRQGFTKTSERARPTIIPPHSTPLRNTPSLFPALASPMRACVPLTLVTTFHVKPHECASRQASGLFLRIFRCIPAQLSTRHPCPPRAGKAACQSVSCLTTVAMFHVKHWTSWKARARKVVTSGVFAPHPTTNSRSSQEPGSNVTHSAPPDITCFV